MTEDTERAMIRSSKHANFVVTNIADRNVILEESTGTGDVNDVPKSEIVNFGVTLDKRPGEYNYYY